MGFLRKSAGTSVTLDLFKTLERFKIIDNIVNPAEWTMWYAEVKAFARKHGH
ncbi:hypothetical protein UFOVP53_205 [uncultured Caudovirales phage]|uniref:Uncharacterized protein n=1 Tax=uncultured Caudovirales phage TaxID=2100421 RepID=A0A6J5KWU4_9CAUD|nr:hypothetical protein UFOVP53_205 [uncultured Caudovirales phage]